MFSVLCRRSCVLLLEAFVEVRGFHQYPREYVISTTPPPASAPPPFWPWAQCRCAPRRAGTRAATRSRATATRASRASSASRMRWREWSTARGAGAASGGASFPECSTTPGAPAGARSAATTKRCVECCVAFGLCGETRILSCFALVLVGYALLRQQYEGCCTSCRGFRQTHGSI